MQPRLGNLSSSLLARNGNREGQLAKERERDGDAESIFTKLADPISIDFRICIQFEPKNSKSHYLFRTGVQESENSLPRIAKNELSRQGYAQSIKIKIFKIACTLTERVPKIQEFQNLSVSQDVSQPSM